MAESTRGSTLSHLGYKWWGAQGPGGNLNASLDGVCDEDKYSPSLLEQSFSAHAVEWTQDEASLCEHLNKSVRSIWLDGNVEGNVTSGDAVFSRLCKKGMAPQLLEPLAGVLRHPKMFCEGTGLEIEMNINWLVLADYAQVTSSPKKIIFDAGGSNFNEGMHFFTAQYEKLGIKLDKIFVWEATPRGSEAYWHGVSSEIREKWEPHLTFYDGVPITADPNDEKNNPVRRILAECKPEDFCSFKLDIDAPDVELPVVEQLLATREVAAVLDEFFFEHHVEGLMQIAWRDEVNGTFADSYDIFTKLRKMGVRAHSWI